MNAPERSVTAVLRASPHRLVLVAGGCFRLRGMDAKKMKQLDSILKMKREVGYPCTKVCVLCVCDQLPS